MGTKRKVWGEGVWEGGGGGGGGLGCATSSEGE